MRRTLLRKISATLTILTMPAGAAWAARAPKVHTVAVGRPQPVVWTDAGGAGTKLTMRVRPLVVDDKRRAWVTGDVHDVTDHSFVALEVQHLNDALPGDKAAHFIWKATGWLLVERSNGHISELKLAGYDPAISGLEWFRDYAAYCAVSTTATRSRLDAVILQLGTHKPVARKRVSNWPMPAPDSAAAETAPAQPSAAEAGAPNSAGCPTCAKPGAAVNSGLSQSPTQNPKTSTSAAHDASPRPQVCSGITWQRDPLQATFTVKPGDPAVTLAPGPAPATEVNDSEP